MESTISKLKGVAAALLLFNSSISYAGLSDEGKSSASQAMFERAVQGAKLGDETAISQLQSIESTLLDSKRVTSATALDYRRSVAEVVQANTEVASATQGLATTQQTQLTLMTQQVTALGVINSSVLTVADAITAMRNANTSLASANANALAGGSQTVSQLNSSNNYASSQAAIFSQSSPNAQKTLLALAQKLESGYGSEAWKTSATSYLHNKGVPGYALGGLASGWAMVGEQGPELVNFTQPGRVYTAGQTKDALSNADTASEIRALRAELNAALIAIALNTSNTAKKMSKWDGEGLPDTRTP